MNILNFLKTRRAGFYFGALAAAASVAALIIYSVYAAANGVNALVLIMLIACLLSSAGYAAVGLGVLPVLSALFAAVAAGVFFCDTYGTYIDYIYQVNFWGDVTQLGRVIAVTVTSGLAAVFSVAAAFTGGISEKYKFNSKK